MAFIKKTLRILVIGALLAYFALATAMLGVRYLVLPHINDWRPKIEAHLSRALEANVSMGEISASWSGLNPTLTLGNLRVHDRQTNQQLLYIPNAFAVVSWRTIFARELRFRQLEVNGVELVASRRTDGRIVVAGTLLDEQGPETLSLSTDTPAIRWLIHQDRILVRDASFRWDDSLRAAPELLIEGIEFNIANGLFRHQLRISGSLPKDLGGKVELIVQTQNILNPLASHERADAEIFIEINDAQPSAWAPWIDLPRVQGRFGARAWLGVSEKHFGRMTLDLSGSHVSFSADTQQPLVGRAEEIQIKINGWLGDLFPDHQGLLFERSPNRVGLSLDLQSKGVKVETSLFEPSMLSLGDISTKTQWNRGADQQLRVNATDLRVQANNLTAALQGTWTQAPGAAFGIANVSGNLKNVDSTKLHQYVSTVLSAETRHWMQRAFIRGMFDQIDVKLQGDLTQFPFNKEGQSGVFSLSAQYSDMLLDYDYGETNTLHWPALAMKSGSLFLDNLSLNVKSTQASYRAANGVSVPISSVELQAPDLGLNSKLVVRSQSQGLAADYLTILRGTPFVEYNSPIFETLQTTGTLAMPLVVEFDTTLRRVTALQGELNFSDVSLALVKDGMPIEKINGVVQFTQDNTNFNQVQGTMLGGPLTLSGEWGPNKRSASVRGEVTSVATEKYQALSQLLAVTGKATYEMEIKGTQEGGVDAQLKSSLQGLTIKLPEPLGKLAAQSRPLTVRFLSTKPGADAKNTLTFSLANILNARFEGTPSLKSQSYFSRGAIVMGGSAVLPRAGMAIDLSFNRVKWADWNAVTDQWITTSPNKSTSAGPRVFPSLQQLRVRSPEFIIAELTLNELDLMVSQTAGQKWAARLDSRETRGDINWTFGQKGLSGPVIAKFSKLSVGTKGSVEGELPRTEVIDENQWASMPAIDLQIDDFTMFGSRLGYLHLVGENVQNGSQWLIKDLEVTSPNGKMKATGTWQLKGPERGVSLDAQINIDDLGKLSDQMGHVDRVNQGSGSIKANINWLNFPWVYSYAGLQGNASIDLKEGVFQHVNSRSARLLEVLSLQSLQRILSFNFRTGDEFKEGFPWNTIIGNISITNGLVTTKELVIRSPIARITLTGGSDLKTKIWDMDADVRPILDMSGAALATAFVVNPIAGLSALVTQFILRHPIERGMSAQYKVRGPWDDPILDPIGVPKPEPERPNPGG